MRVEIVAKELKLVVIAFRQSELATPGQSPSAPCAKACLIEFLLWNQWSAHKLAAVPNARKEQKGRDLSLPTQ